MGSVEPLVMAGEAGEGGGPGSLRVDRKCWNKVKLIYGGAAGGAELDLDLDVGSRELEKLC